MSLLLVRDRRHLAALEREWVRLHAASVPRNPFLSWEWQHAWIEAQPHSVVPWVVAESLPDGTLAGLLALQRRRHRGLRQLELLGQGSGADELDCLLHPEADAGLAARLVRAGMRLGGWDLMQLDAVRAASALGRGIATVTGARGPLPGDWLPYLRLPDTLEELLQQHSANFRAEVRRRRRRWERAVPEARLVCAEAPADIGEGLHHLFRLHNLRRAQKKGEGMFESARTRAFHHRVAVRLAARGAARLYLLRTPTAVVAALYGLVAEDRFYYFQSGFDPAWTAASPGTVLLSHVLDDCMRRGQRQFEFLRGSEGYKGRWTTERRRAEEWSLAQGALGRGYVQARHWWRRFRRPAADGAGGAIPLPPGMPATAGNAALREEGCE